MPKNPYLNAVLAATYIVLLVSGLFASQSLEIQEPNVLIPITMLSVLVFSVALMGYLFGLQPTMLFMDGKKKEAIDFFTKTLMTFAGICILFAITLVLVG